MVEYYACGKGWLPLIHEAQDIISKYNMEHPNDDPLNFTDIKEKFGGLSLYLNYYIPEIFDKIHEIEDSSFSICEHCGTDKDVKTEWTHGWIMTLCDECRKKELEEFYNRFNKGTS